MPKDQEYVLVTGGAGYIGGHMAGLLVSAGRRVVVADNLSTGVMGWIPEGTAFIKADLCSLADCQKIFETYQIDAVLHFAAKIVVPESVSCPAAYYANNVGGTLNLLNAMTARGVRKFVFSSTAAVYGDPAVVPISEEAPLAPLNPYGTSKWLVEQVLSDCANLGVLDYISLRYFNVAGWDTRRSWPRKGRPSPTHLISNAMQALHKGPPLVVCGENYPTPDGTGVRDFIHVMDLCEAHLLALDALSKGTKNQVFNLGNCHGFSVMDVIRTASQVAQRPVPYGKGPRRPGDVATLVASCEKARRILGWKPKFDLEAILKSEWQRSLTC
ncbi:MAG: UDP-glucose 4-epimerase GalE [Candidatus Omnitrophica bacterium]|nr:UDP-glucose 4-epimerase GalE [Candidatus Omnitrophota bacterium]